MCAPGTVQKHVSMVCLMTIEAALLGCIHNAFKSLLSVSSSDKFDDISKENKARN